MTTPTLFTKSLFIDDEMKVSHIETETGSMSSTSSKASSDEDEEEDDEDENSSSVASLSRSPSSESLNSSVSISRSSSLESLENNNSNNVKFSSSFPYLSSKATPTSSSISLVTIPSHDKFRSFVHKHEIPRKFLHISIGFVTLWLYTKGYEVSQITPVLTTMFIIIGGTDLIRFRNPKFNQFYVKSMGFLMREKEVDGYNGVIWYLLGLIIVFLFFSKDISLLAVLLLSWADTAASTVGRAYGYLTPKIGNKSLAGSGAAFVTGVLSTWLLYSFFIPRYNFYNKPGDILWSPETSQISLPILTLVAGLIAAVSEAIDIVDDNFSIPVLSSIFMWAFIKFTSTGTYESSIFI